MGVLNYSRFRGERVGACGKPDRPPLDVRLLSLVRWDVVEAFRIGHALGVKVARVRRIMTPAPDKGGRENV